MTEKQQGQKNLSKLSPWPHELRKMGTAGLKHVGGLSVSIQH